MSIDFSNYIGKFVVVRCYASGVHYGTLKAYDPITRHALLTNSRILWGWKGAFTLNAVVTNGITEGKIPVAVEEQVLTDVLGFVICTEKAKDNLEKQPVHVS